MEKTYSNGDITVHWQPEKCIHSRKCWTGLKAVFDPQARPWVNINGADSATIMKQVDACPSGALSYTKDSPADANTEPCYINISSDGPLLVKGLIELTDHQGNKLEVGKTVALCRCGASSNKPFCDGSHRKVGFKG